MSTTNVVGAPAQPETGEPQLDLPADIFREGPVAGSLDVMNANDMVERLHYANMKGLAIFEGDILLGTHAELAGPIPKGLAITHPDDGGARFRWPGGTVPYVVEATHLQENIDYALAHWLKHTPLRFILRTNENADQYPDYLSFEDHGSCYSHVGRQGGKQIISLMRGCTAGTTMHEIGHAVGLWHEQSRADRDQFIKIRFENIREEARYNFKRHVLKGSMSGEYDYDSIMHYSAKAFSMNGLSTIEPVDATQKIGQRRGLSKGDILAVKAMYPSLDWTNHPVG